MKFGKYDVLQPFFMEILPIKQLVLFNLDKNPDKIYSGLELQRLESPIYGNSFRLIAYRVDGFIDVYDEPGHTASEKDKEGFNVCGKGLKNYVVTPFSDVCIDLKDGNLRVHFGLCDYTGRKIDVLLEEHAKRASKAFDLIAPVGASSEAPVSLPVFAMYQFDVVRKRNTIVSITIDDRTMIPDSFPVPFPKDGQMRYFMRYGYDCELIDFGPASKNTLSLYQCTNGRVIDNNLVAEYVDVSGENRMHSLSFCHSKHAFKVLFEDGFPDLLRMKDTTITSHFKMQMEESMGYFSGEYTVNKHEQSIDIILEPSDGWTVQSKTFFTKMMLQKKSVFRAWPTTYRYTQHIDLATLNSTTSWERLEKDIKTTI